MIEYAETIEGVDAEDLRGFFDGWRSPPSPEQHLALLRGSAHVVLARDGRRVVGFVTALSDGVISAFIPLPEVRPEYKGQGIGSELVQRLLERLASLRTVDLACDPELEPFYARFGMVPLGGMAIRR